jgi:hypothetical protein
LHLKFWSSFLIHGTNELANTGAAILKLWYSFHFSSIEFYLFLIPFDLIVTNFTYFITVGISSINEVNYCNMVLITVSTLVHQMI